MRSLLPGLIVGVLGVILSFVIHNSDMIMYGLFIIGFVPIIISGFMSRAYVGGDRVRGKYSNSKDYNELTGRSNQLFLFGIPFVLAAIAVYFVS